MTTLATRHVAGEVTLKRLARAMPAGLAVYDSQGHWQPARHHQALNLRLLDVAAGRVKRLIVTMPPQHGKSTLTSRYFPAWYIGNRPTEHINLVSYESTFARTHGRAARDILARNADVFGVEVRADVASTSDWETPQGGGMFSTGIGGPLTGRPGNILVDDPIKNQEEARSPTMQAKAWDWWVTVPRTRMRPQHWAIVMMTRWSTGDLVGRILEEDPDEWIVLNLPAIAGENDALGRKPGEYLWLKRRPTDEAGFTADFYQKQRMAQGPSWWAAMYQGNPVPDDGMLFKRSMFRYWRIEGDDNGDRWAVLPDGRRFNLAECSRVSMMDPAATEGETSAFTCIGTWLITPQHDLLLRHVVRERAETTKHRGLIDGVRARFRPDVIGVEKGAYGYHILQSLAAEGYPLKPLRADKDKVARARIAEARYDLGKVYHLATDPDTHTTPAWLAAYEEELLLFPAGRYKDQVDVTAYACSYVAYSSNADDDDSFDLEFV